jgi:hypothetical protein
VKNIEVTMPEPWQWQAIVWVVDNGTMTSHEDLVANTISFNNNGNGHGTHTAWSVWASTDNGIGVPAISYNFARVAAAWWGLSTNNTKTRTDRARDQWAIAVNWSWGCQDSLGAWKGEREDRITQRSDLLFFISA